MYVYGASATAEWMNVPPGTWTAETSAEKPNRIAAYVKNGPKSGERRRAHAPTSTSGSRNRAAISVL